MENEITGQHSPTTNSQVQPPGPPPPLGCKTNTFAKSDSDLLKNMDEKSRAKSQNVTDICMVGATFVPLTIQSSVKFCDFVEQYLRSVWTYHLYIY